MGQMDQWEPHPAKGSYCVTSRRRRGRKSPFTWHGRKSDKDPSSGSLKAEKRHFLGHGQRKAKSGLVH